jgi:hypothetical protein
LIRLKEIARAKVQFNFKPLTVKTVFANLKATPENTIKKVFKHGLKTVELGWF